MNRLENHNTLAIDFDDTLIDHRNSRRLIDHIKHNPHKTYWIVTFRSGAWEDEDALFAELYHKGNIDKQHFAGVKFIPNDLFEDADNRHIDFISWKGMMARSLGCTVLIDDRPTWVEYGCEKYGVEFINTHEIKPYKD